MYSEPKPVRFGVSQRVFYDESMRVSSEDFLKRELEDMESMVKDRIWDHLQKTDCVKVTVEEDDRGFNLTVLASLGVVETVVKVPTPVYPPIKKYFRAKLKEFWEKFLKR